MENGDKENIRIQRPLLRTASAGKLCAKSVFFVIVLVQLEGDGGGFARLGELFEEHEFEGIHYWMVVYWIGFRGSHGLRSGRGGDGDEVMVVGDGDELRMGALSDGFCLRGSVPPAPYTSHSSNYYWKPMEGGNSLGRDSCLHNTRP